MSRDGRGAFGAGFERGRAYVYRGTVPGGLGVLLLIPVLLFFVCVVAVVAMSGLVGGLLLPLVLPLIWWRRGRGRAPTDPHCIELNPNDYRTIESDAPPPR
jgi:hypothetical protein